MRDHGMRSVTFQLLPATLLVLCTSLTTHAATFCATTTNELKADLITAAGNNQNNTINVHLGTYDVPAGGFVYNAIDPSANFNLDLEGGWYGSSPGQCLVQEFTGAETVLDGQNTDPVMNIQTTGTSGNITLRYFTFQNGLGNPPSLDIIAFDSTGAIRVENSLFRGNHTKTANGTDENIVEVSGYVGVIYFLDNAIVDNVGVPESDALYLYSGDTSDQYAVYMNNNTITGNTASDASPLDGFNPNGAGEFTVSNNIVWDGGTTDIFNYSHNAPNMIFANNDVDSFFATPAMSSNDINKDPKFIDAAHGNYRLMPDSPARDVGENSPPGTTRNYDLDGNPRVVFGTVDMGAYEIQDEIFAGSFGG
jgi:hypothetical protein